MNTYYKIAAFYLILSAVFAIFGFYMSADLRKIDNFYKRPYLVNEDEGEGGEEDADQGGEIA